MVRMLIPQLESPTSETDTTYIFITGTVPLPQDSEDFDSLNFECSTKLTENSFPPRRYCLARKDIHAENLLSELDADVITADKKRRHGPTLLPMLLPLPMY
ncbi:uncharacterized protein ACWYII_039552 [Salvelinus alpinus]